MKKLTLLLAAILSLNAHAEGFDTVRKPRLKLGNGQSVDTTLEFQLGLGGSNPLFRYLPGSSKFTLSDDLDLTGGLTASGIVDATGGFTGPSLNMSSGPNTLGGTNNLTGDLMVLGDGTNGADKVIKFDDGSAGSNSVIKKSVANNRLEFCNDGTNCKALGSGSGGSSGGINVLSNPGFEDPVSASNWVASTGAQLTIVSLPADAGEVLEEEKSGKWDPAAVADTLTSELYDIKNQKALDSQTCMVGMRYSWEGGTAGDISLRALDGNGNVLATIDPTPTTGATAYVFQLFNCPDADDATLANREIQAQLYANANAAAITVDGFHLGSNIREVQVAGADRYGTLRYPTVGSCSWSSSGTSWADLPANASCTGAVTTDYASTPSTATPAIKFANLPPGKYEVKAQATFTGSGTTANDNDCEFRISSNTTDANGVSSGPAVDIRDNTADLAGSPSMSGSFAFTTAKTGVVFTIQSIRLAGVDSCTINAGSSNRELSFSVIRYPLDSEKGLTLDQQGWYVDAVIYGATTNLSIVGTTSTLLANASWTMELLPGSASVMIPCSGTNAATGLTCSSGNEQMGAVFTPPQAGNYEVCMDTGASVISNAADDPVFYLKIFRTSPTNDATVLYTGRNTSSFGDSSSTQVVAHNGMTHTCETINFPAAVQTALRMEYTTTGASASSSISVATGTSTLPLGHVTIRPVIQNSGVVIPNAVTSAPIAKPKQYGFIVDCGAASTINYDPAGVVSSIGNVSAGGCAVTLNSGFFSQKPVCTAITNSGGFGANGVMLAASASTATALTIDCKNDASSDCSSYSAAFNCWGQ